MQLPSVREIMDTMSQAELKLIRNATPDDAVPMADIYRQSVEACDSTMASALAPDEFASIISGLGAREALLVSEIGGRVAGWGQVKSYSPRPGYRVAGETSIF